MLIAFEGIDGAGKTTQVKLLNKYLGDKGIDSTISAEPTDSPIGKMLKSILSGKEDLGANAIVMQLLFAADRAYHMNSINKWNKEGKVVLEDRYIFSTIAFGSAAGLDRGWLKKLNSVFPLPSLTFIIDLDPSIAIKRIHKRNDVFKEQSHFTSSTNNEDSDRQRLSIYEKIELLTKVRDEYLKIAKEYPNCFVIDGSKELTKVNLDIISILCKNATINLKC
jgi:dTMP kinase